MTPTTVDPLKSSTAHVFAPRVTVLVVLAVVMALVPILFGVFSFLRGQTEDLWIGLAVGAVFAAAFGAIALYYGRQRVVVDNGAVWVRYGRWHGPIRLSEVVAVQHYANRAGRGLVLVQANVGSVIGAWSAANSLGHLRRSRFREVQTQDGPLRYIHLPSFAFHASVLRLIARPLLLRPSVMIDDVCRNALLSSLNAPESPATPRRPAGPARG